MSLGKGLNWHPLDKDEREIFGGASDAALLCDEVTVCQHEGCVVIADNDRLEILVELDDEDRQYYLVCEGAHVEQMKRIADGLLNAFSESSLPVELVMERFGFQSSAI